MNNRQSERIVLLVILFVFAISVGIVQGRKIKHQEKREVGLIINPLLKEEVSAQYVLNHINPLLLSRSVNTLAKVLKQFRPAVVREVLERIVVGANPLNRDEKISLILALGASFPLNKQAQHSFFDLFSMYPFLQAGTPHLILAAESEKPEVISDVLAWIKENEKTKWVQQALNFAIQRDNIDALKTLYKYNIPISTQESAQLVLAAIEGKKEPILVRFLLDQGVPVDYVNTANKRTLLMEAVAVNNAPAVKILLQRGADPDRIINDSVGSAMQIAFERGHVQLEKLMRKYSKK